MAMAGKDGSLGSRDFANGAGWDCVAIADAANQGAGWQHLGDSVAEEEEEEEWMGFDD